MRGFSEAVKGGSGLGGAWLLVVVALVLFLLFETPRNTRASDVVNLELLEKL